MEEGGKGEEKDLRRATRETVEGAAAVEGSSRTGWNLLPGVSSSSDEAAACQMNWSARTLENMTGRPKRTGRRRRPLGPATMRGFRKLRFI